MLSIPLNIDIIIVAVIKATDKFIDHNSRYGVASYSALFISLIIIDHDSHTILQTSRCPLDEYFLCKKHWTHLVGPLVPRRRCLGRMRITWGTTHSFFAGQSQLIKIIYIVYFSSFLYLIYHHQSAFGLVLRWCHRAIRDECYISNYKKSNNFLNKWIEYEIKKTYE